MTEQPVVCLQCADGKHDSCDYNVTVWKSGYGTIHVCQCTLDGHVTKDLESVINAIVADEDMPEHMVTRNDDKQMRALLYKHLEPVWKSK